MEFPDMRNKRVRVVEIITYGVDVLPFEHEGTYEEQLAFAQSYVGREGMAKGNQRDGSLSDEYVVTFDDGKIGSFVNCELELVKEIS